MNLLKLVIAKTHKTEYQMFYLAFNARDGQVEDEFVQSMYRLFQQSDILPATVQQFCLDVLQGRREV